LGFGLVLVVVLVLGLSGSVQDQLLA